MKAPRRQFLPTTGRGRRRAAGRLALRLGAGLSGRPCAHHRRLWLRQLGDILARLVGQGLSERLGQPFVIEIEDAGGNLGAEAVVRAPPDGYTLLLCGSPGSNQRNNLRQAQFQFHPRYSRGRGIAVGRLSSWCIHRCPAKTVPEFIYYARANPGKVDFRLAGIGTVAHMAGELVNVMADIKMVHVPYRGLAPALTDLLGGRVPAIFSTLPPSIEDVRAGKLRALAVTSAVVLEALPDLPTIGDFLPSFKATFLTGLARPRTRVPKSSKTQREINAALADPNGRPARLTSALRR